MFVLVPRLKPGNAKHVFFAEIDFCTDMQYLWFTPCLMKTSSNLS